MPDGDVTPRGQAALLGPAEVRALAANLGVKPTKQLGQNFVHDANTVRRIVTAAGVTADDVVVEVGPGLGSLTLALLDVADRYNLPVLSPPIPRTVRFAEASASGASVLKGRKNKGATAYRELAENLWKHWEAGEDVRTFDPS